MKRIGVFWIIMLFVAGLCRSELTITDCYELARVNYPQIKQYGLIDQTRDFDIGNVNKKWLPQIMLTAQASYQSDVVDLPVDKSSLPFDIPTLSKDHYKVAANLEQTIWDGGAASSSRKIINAQSDAEKTQLDSRIYELNSRVNQLYFGCLLQDELINQNLILQKDLQNNIERIKVMIQNGVANQSDLEIVEVELLNTKQKEIELRAERKNYRQMLGVFINREIGDEEIFTEPVCPSVLSREINRPELKYYDAMEVLFNAQKKYVDAGLMPKFGLFIQGGYGRPGMNMLENSFEPYFIAGVRMSWNIGNLYTMKNDRRRIEAGVKSVDVDRETFIFNTRLELMQHDSEINKMNRLMQTDNEIIRLRSSIKKASEVKLENGVISVTDLIRDINAEDMARQTAVTHKIIRLMSVYNFMYTTN